MRIMGTDGCEDVHWGQCFEEFYGPEYCKNLKKDLEKLKDEFYDGNARRFQREWVVPTANLLRRMRHMGFPVRTREFILIHLYNPVDSMFAGEMHFQVGRKVPGTLTLKFTKQNTSGTFVIQPKTLSNLDEMKLNEDPLDFFDHVRHEMRDSSVDTSNLLRTLVLMTETCKLQRHCAKTFFSNAKENAPTSKPVYPDMPTGFPGPRVPFANNQWTTKLLNPEMSSARQDGSLIPIPMNFCVKNYVNCSSKPVSEIGLHNLPLGTGHHKMVNGTVNAGIAYRQLRSSTWHSEPEENDETIDLQSFNESNWPRLPPDSMEEIQRRMSDTRLWEATKVSATESKPGTSTQSAAYGNFVAQSVGVEAKVWSSGETRTSLTDEYTGDQNAPERSSLQEWRYSEPRTAATEEYFRNETGPAQGTMANPDSSGRRESTSERTSLTEDYAGQAQSMTERTSLTEEYAGQAQERSSGKDSPFKGNFTAAIMANNSHLAGTAPGSVSPRTAVVNEYTRTHSNATDQLGGNPVPYAFVPRTMATGGSQSKVVDMQEGRRTSSLDAYVGSVPRLGIPTQEQRASSENNLAALPPRTNLVDQYFQGQKPNALWQMRPLDLTTSNEQLPLGGATEHRQPSNFCNYQLFPAGSGLGASPGGQCYGLATDTTQSLPEANGTSLDSWMSHCNAGPAQLANDRLRASSVGSTYERSRVPELADEVDVSLLSHTSYPSWASHPGILANPAAAPLPLAIEQINKNSQNWKQWAPPNSLNYDQA